MFYICTVFTEPVITTGIEETFSDLSVFASGMIVGLIFFSKVNVYFDKSRLHTEDDRHIKKIQ